MSLRPLAVCLWCVAFVAFFLAPLSHAELTFQDVAAAKNLISTGTTYGGAWVPDFNGDSRPDLFSANHSTADDPVLYLSTPAGGFAVAPPSTFAGFASRDFHGSGWADIDNDGDKDLLVVAGAGRGLTSVANMLLVNNGNGVLGEAAAAYGIDYPFARSRDLLWVDWNNDSYLDVLLLNRNDRTLPPDAKTQMFTFDPGVPGYVEESFPLAPTIQQSWAQLSFNNPSVGGSAPVFFTVKRVNGGVVDSAFSYGPGGLSNVKSAIDMPDVAFTNDSAMGDFNNDGAQDVVFVAGGGANLFLQSATGFSAAPGFNGQAATSGAFVVVEDFNNDMWLDIYVARSNVATQANLPNVLYLNQGDGTFATLQQAGGAQGTLEGYVSTTASVDYNNDGRMDIYTANSENWWVPRELTLDAPMQLFENQDSSGNHWLKIQLRGTQSNSDGIGASVWVTAGGVTQLREMNGGMHARTQNDSRLHFGLAGQAQATTVVVNWPSGVVQTLSDVPADQILTIVEPTGGVNLPPTAQFVSSPSSTALALNFSAEGSFDPDGEVASWTWDFGDQTSGQGESLVHTFPEPGTYSVSLTVADMQGETDTVSQDVVVVSGGAGLVRVAITPIAVGAKAFKMNRLVDELADGTQNFVSFWDSGANLGKSWATFDLGANYPVREVHLAPRANVTTQFEIFIGDTLSGGMVSDASVVGCTVPQSSGNPRPSSLFSCSTPAGAGRYVTVSVPNVVFQRIHGAEVFVTGGAVNESPIASFMRNPISGEAPLGVDVDASGSFDMDGDIVSYEWDFGNGDTGTGVLANVMYADAGQFTITLTVTDDGGASSQTTQEVSVQGPPVAPEITQQPQSVTTTEGQGATFSVTATGTPTLAYEWFRDGLTIAGEVSSSLVLAGLQLADDGAVFTVAVQNAVDTVTSAAAVLTVTENSGEPVKQPVQVHAVGANAFKSHRAIDETGTGAQDLSTNWASASDPDEGWITLDLGTTRSIAAIRLGMAPNRSYEIEVTIGDTISGGVVDGASVQICSVAQGSGQAPTFLTPCELQAGTGRYITLRVPARKWVRIHGLEVYVQP